MSNSSSPKKAGRNLPKASSESPAGTSKLDTLVALLRSSKGASIMELTSATNWQAHSVRGALAGALKKKGHVISSDVIDGTRRYRIAGAQA